MTAKEMFDSLGYSCEYDNDFEVVYETWDTAETQIQFDIIARAIYVSHRKSVYVDIDNWVETEGGAYLSVDVMRAIFQQMKELGWI